jgi:predicted membrane chloride channel (bestrophin family)
MNSLSTLQQMSIVAGVLVALVVSITLAAVWLANRQNAAYDRELAGGKCPCCGKSLDA